MDPNMFIKLNDNKIINKNEIKWMTTYEDCIYICTKSNGCINEAPSFGGTHKVCKNNYAFNELIKLFYN